MNKILLIGRLTKDIEITKTTSGATVGKLILAVNRRTKNEGQPDADFISCIAWNKIAELLEQYTHKGSQIGIEGKLQTRNYETQEGQKRYVSEVIIEGITLLGSKQNDAQNENYGVINEEEIPF